MDAVKQVPLTEHHDRPDTASLEQLRALSGSIPFTGSLPSKELLDPEDMPESAEHAGD